MLAPAVVTMVATVRTYGISLVSAPLRWVAEKVGSPSRVIAAASLLVAVLRWICRPALGCERHPHRWIGDPLAFIANGVFGIVSSQLTEGKVAPAVFGTASGLLSVIGFLPDTLHLVWFDS